MSTRSFIIASVAPLLIACPPSEGVTSHDPSATGTSNVSTTTTLDPKTSGPEDPSSTTDETDTTTGDATTSSSTTDMPPICGDGFIQPGEECDDGEANDDHGACTEQCTAATCGDGFVQPGEACDLGEDNDNLGACTNLCELAACGDGFIQPGEACDDGEDNDANTQGACHPETCQVVTTCGDGVIQDDEECGWDDLADGTILSPIRKDELGEDATEMVTVAWTGTTVDGGAYESHCNAWTSGGLFGEGLTGWLTATDSAWTHLSVYKCGSEAHLYCIET